MMKFKFINYIAFAFCFFILSAVSCSKSAHINQSKDLIITEVMASNRTGLLDDNGKTSDWIEIRNTSSKPIDLEGYILSVTKSKTKEDKDSVENSTKTWEFPSVELGAGEYMIVFADKSKKNKDKTSDSPQKSLTANLNLPKEGGSIQLLTADEDVISEVNYKKVLPDQALALQSDGSFITTYWQTPGFENTPQGYVSASERIDSQRKDPLRIWELMSRAKKSNENWVELKNVGESDIDLSEYKLSKKMGKNEGWSLPQKTLKPGQIITVQLFGKQANINNQLHAPFKLGSAETVILSKNDKFVDGVNAKLTTIGGSVGRITDEKGIFYFPSPSRNSENSNSGKRFIANKPSFDFKPGVYSKQDSILIRLKDKSRVVHYTLDGSAPTESSPVFPDSILLTRNTTLRSFTEGDSVSLRSDITTDSYILGANHNLAVINITVNNDDLYDHNKGIYAKGPGYSPEWPHQGANFWKKWTKNAHVEFFDDNDNDGFSVDCGLMIFGGFSRYEDKKSFRLKFRGQYGQPQVEYDFFGNGNPIELKDVVLRSGSQDYNRCMIRDEFFTSLLQAQSPTLLTQSYRPVALYVNAEYFGLYYIREKIDKNFVVRLLNVPNDDINIIMSKGYNEEGSGEPYKQLMAYVSSQDMTKSENYEYMRKNVDLQGLIDYKLGEIYSGNSDVGNIRYVRSTAPESDKMWRFVFYDLDASWVQGSPRAAYYLTTGPAANGVKPHNIMISNLLNNKEFRNLFLERLSHHLKNTFSTKNATAVFDKLIEQIKPEMKRNCERWPKLSYERWEKNIAEFRDRFTNRPKDMLNDIRNVISVTDAENKKYFSSLGY